MHQYENVKSVKVYEFMQDEEIINSTYDMTNVKWFFITIAITTINLNKIINSKKYINYIYVFICLSYYIIPSHSSFVFCFIIYSFHPMLTLN